MDEKSEGVSIRKGRAQKPQVSATPAGLPEGKKVKKVMVTTDSIEAARMPEVSVKVDEFVQSEEQVRKNPDDNSPENYSIVYLAFNKNRTRTEYDPEDGHPITVNVDSKERRIFGVKVHNKHLINNGMDWVLEYNQKLVRARKDNLVSIIRIEPCKGKEQALTEQMSINKILRDDAMEEVEDGDEQ